VLLTHHRKLDRWLQLGGHSDGERGPRTDVHDVPSRFPLPQLPDAITMLEQARAELAPTGVLRAGINMSNFLLVTGKSAAGDPEGVSPDMARAVADRLGVPLQLVPFRNPGELADAALEDRWDIGNIGAEPERAKTITFTAAYVEIEATYLVPAGSPIRSIEEVDRDGVRIAVSQRSAYELWLSDNIEHATLVMAQGLDASFELFVERKLEALAGLRPKLISDVQKLPGARILDGKFTAVQQAIGTKPDRKAGAAFLRAFVEEAKANGLVRSLIEKHGVVGRLTVAPPG
jgi:polar amino acid transport system substrate-binding protein